MSDSVRKQIRAAVRALVLPLRDTLNLRYDPEWVNDPLKHLDLLPNLTMFSGDDTTIATDSRGRTKQFQLTFKFCFEQPRAELLEDLADDYISAITEVIEGNIQLGGLVDILDNRTHEVFADTLQTPIGVVLVTWRCQYRHVLARPEMAY